MRRQISRSSSGMPAPPSSARPPEVVSSETLGELTARRNALRVGSAADAPPNTRCRSRSCSESGGINTGACGARTSAPVDTGPW